MSATQPPSQTHVESQLEGQVVLRLQFIQAALAAGVLALAAVVMALHVKRLFDESTAEPKASVVGLLNGLSLANPLAAISAFLAAWMLPGGVFSLRRVQSMLDRSDRPHDDPGGDDPDGQDGADEATAVVRRCLAILVKAMVFRLALLEAAAMFGLAVCLLATLLGVMDINGWYWLNAIPAAAFLVYGAATFPTRSRLAGRIRLRRVEAYEAAAPGLAA